jgi:hypothetical protein
MIHDLTKDRCIKAFDPAELAAMTGMETTLDA